MGKIYVSVVKSGEFFLKNLKAIPENKKLYLKHGLCHFIPSISIEKTRPTHLEYPF